jgi:hypothetical protein
MTVMPIDGLWKCQFCIRNDHGKTVLKKRQGLRGTVNGDGSDDDSNDDDDDDYSDEEKAQEPLKNESSSSSGIAKNKGRSDSSSNIHKSSGSTDSSSHRNTRSSTNRNEMKKKRIKVEQAYQTDKATFDVDIKDDYPCPLCVLACNGLEDMQIHLLSNCESWAKDPNPNRLPGQKYDINVND